MRVDINYTTALFHRDEAALASFLVDSLRDRYRVASARDGPDDSGE